MRDIVEAKLENFGIEPSKLARLDDYSILDLFCNTFDLKMSLQRNEELEKENTRMKEELSRLYGVDRPFICGDVGEADEHGLREFYLVSPSYGANGSALYKKHKGYTE